MPLRPFAALLSGLALTSLAGCASLSSSNAAPPPAEYGQQALAQAEDCCASLAALPFQTLDAERTQPLRLNTNAPVHRFEDGKSFFQAFALPRDAGPLSFELTSTIVDGQVFAPTVLVLNEDFQPTQRIASDKFRYQGPSGFAPARLTATFNITPGPEAAYLVVYSNETARQGTTQYESAEKVYARVRGLALPPGPDPVAQHTATGSVTLATEPHDAGGGLLTPILGDRATTPTPEPRIRATRDTSSTDVMPAGSSDFDYRRMIDAALKAGDIELAMQLAERAEREGQHGIRAWLAERLRAVSP
ncbi:maltose operon protein [Chromohalobacter marismortui]|uniref:Maltose operon protein n=1 Tax=Chromohalobacter marismortui TaxID=42055 RepID=A0A4V3F433_9GAMM|nr:MULTISPECIES: MalM family protein [Chromohalobacter]MCI0509754.1 MalM family protein [Chromohalobacter sp.]MCI0594885.1 MalM family protein [Chromohalobacter sp.]TDU21976.1 maltose operon protein [Chromohalobacter marismortui]